MSSFLLSQIGTMIVEMEGGAVVARCLECEFECEGFLEQRYAQSEITKTIAEHCRWHHYQKSHPTYILNKT